jgi:hypothetical protein
MACPSGAQAPTAVPIPQEPHHHLVLENDYVRVFRVTVPAHESTLLHQHDVPYLYVALGPADVINAVQGKPEAHLVMADGQLGYSPGHFAHIARNDSDLPFNNVTIELLKPQGGPKNICAQVSVGGNQADCPKSNTTPGGVHKQPLFETGNTFVDLVTLDPSLGALSIRQPGVLIVLLGETQIQANSLNAPTEKVMEGDTIWISGSGETILKPRKKDLRFIWIDFTGTPSTAKPQ